MGGLGGFHNFIVRGLSFTTKSNIVPDRIVKQKSLLSHQSQLLSQRSQLVVLNIFPINQNCTGSRIEEPEQQVYQSGLASTAHPDNSNDF